MPRDLPGPRTLLTAFLVGVGHALAATVVAGALFGPGGPTGLRAVYVVVGLFIVGAVVTVSWRTYGLRAPAAVVGLLFLAMAVGSWLTAASPPVAVGPTAFGWYGLGWFVVLGVALVAGLVERQLRGAGTGSASGSYPSDG